MPDTEDQPDRISEIVGQPTETEAAPPVDTAPQIAAVPETAPQIAAPPLPAPKPVVPGEPVPAPPPTAQPMPAAPAPNSAIGLAAQNYAARQAMAPQQQDMRTRYVDRLNQLMAGSASDALTAGAVAGLSRDSRNFASQYSTMQQALAAPQKEVMAAIETVRSSDQKDVHLSNEAAKLLVTSLQQSSTNGIKGSSELLKITQSIKGGGNGLSDTQAQGAFIARAMGEAKAAGITDPAGQLQIAMKVYSDMATRGDIASDPKDAATIQHLVAQTNLANTQQTVVVPEAQAKIAHIQTVIRNENNPLVTGQRITLGGVELPLMQNRQTGALYYTPTQGPNAGVPQIYGFAPNTPGNPLAGAPGPTTSPIAAPQLVQAPPGVGLPPQGGAAAALPPAAPPFAQRQTMPSAQPQASAQPQVGAPAPPMPQPKPMAPPLAQQAEAAAPTPQQVPGRAPPAQAGAEPPLAPHLVVPKNSGGYDLQGNPVDRRSVKERELDGERAASIQELGQNAYGAMTQTMRLKQSLDNGTFNAPDPIIELAKIASTTGIGQRALSELGITQDKLNNTAMAQSLIQKLAFSSVPKGQGQWSNMERLLLSQTLPQLINQPGGNQMIINANLDDQRLAQNIATDFAYSRAHDPNLTDVHAWLTNWYRTNNRDTPDGQKYGNLPRIYPGEPSDQIAPGTVVMTIYGPMKKSAGAP